MGGEPREVIQGEQQLELGMVLAEVCRREVAAGNAGRVFLWLLAMGQAFLASRSTDSSAGETILTGKAGQNFCPT